MRWRNVFIYAPVSQGRNSARQEHRTTEEEIQWSSEICLPVVVVVVVEGCPFPFFVLLLFRFDVSVSERTVVSRGSSIAFLFLLPC